MFLLVCCSVSFLSLGQGAPIAWDDTRRSAWPAEFSEVGIPSSADGAVQKAYFYRTPSAKPQPLIVSLHTWSGDYTQRDPLVAEIAARGWNYIHPDFRGTNNKPEATASPLVVSDIEDAIRYALENSNSDPENVHILGVSGGGLATLLAYMNVDVPVKSFSAWAPISDLNAWYWESVGRKQRYAQDILKSVSEDDEFDWREAVARSPLHQPIPAGRLSEAELFIYTGVHDGYTGSVPVTHSIKFYNKLVLDSLGRVPMLRSADVMQVVSPEEIEMVLTMRGMPDPDPENTIDGRQIHIEKDLGNLHLTLFEGGHEQLPRALSMIPVTGQESHLALNIFTIGDSNGQNRGGWVDQLRTFLPNSTIHNSSQGGRTIGFDNLGRPELNALRNVEGYLDRAREQLPQGKYDYLILCLGTNDTKAEFAEQQDEVVENFGKLLDRIKSHRLYRRDRPKLVFMTPPPMGVEDMEAKYVGGNDRLRSLVPQLMEIAVRKGFSVIDVFHPMQPVFRIYAPDGVHMVPEGQQILAAKLVERIEELQK